MASSDSPDSHQSGPDSTAPTEQSPTDDGLPSIGDADDRAEAMRATIEEWLDKLCDLIEDARESDYFQRWLDVQAAFHDYSCRNVLLILAQMPEATRVAGYNTWQDLDRQVQRGESAIWIWAPIRAPACPECGNSPSYHEQGRTDCTRHEDGFPDTWEEGVVGFKPVPVFDISQTEGEPLPDLDREATGDAAALRPAVESAAEALPVELAIVDETDWDHGEAEGVCIGYSPTASHPVCEVKSRANDADLVRTAIHEIAHGLLHYQHRRDPEIDTSAKEVEAEATAYVVCQHFGLDASGSRFYLSAWSEDPVETIEERLDRIQSTAARIIDTIDSSVDDEQTETADTVGDSAGGATTRTAAVGGDD